MLPNEPSWIGQKLGDRYEIEERIGRGGMSTVYRAVDPNLKRKVAVKIIHPHLTDNPEFIYRFEQEAAAVAYLRHQNIVQVHDFNHVGDIYYMVMEYIAGESLESKLKSLANAQMRLPLSDTVNILAKLCDAVNYAHQRLMIHRDLKPANVMINLFGNPILMDFGIAKILGGNSYTATGAAMGTATYMAPEVVSGIESDHRADIYSLGIMLYELLSGEPPFQGSSTFQIMLKHVNEPVPDIHQFDSTLPAVLVNILAHALAKNPDERYQSAAELGAALTTAGIQLQGSVSDTLAARFMDRLVNLWQQSVSYFDSGQYAVCIDKLDELTRTDSSFQPAKVEELRLTAVDRLYEQAAQLYQDGSYKKSLATLGSLQQRTSPDPEFDQLERQIELGIMNQTQLARLETLYEEANDLVDGRAYDQALLKWESIKRQQKGIPFIDLLHVENRAINGICNALYNQAMIALAHENPVESLRQWQLLQEKDPSFADSQNIVFKANGMIARQQRNRLIFRLGGLLGVVLLLVILFILIRNFSANNHSVATIGTETAVTPITTPLPSATTPATQSTIAAAQVIPTSTPTPTASPKPTNTPFFTSTATTEMITAVAHTSASLFQTANIDSTEIAVIFTDAEVVVLGRTANGEWLYVQTELDGSGFVDAERFTVTVDLGTLVVIEPPPVETSPISTLGPLKINMYPFAETAVCQEGFWSVNIFIEGQGGSGIFSYYWEGDLIIENVRTGHTFTINTQAEPLTGTGRVISTDGQERTFEIFFPKQCNN
jgi:serine/threonine protein kinase